MIVEDFEKVYTDVRGAERYHRWQLDGGNNRGGIFRFEAGENYQPEACRDNDRDRKKAVENLDAGRGVRFPLREQTRPDEVVPGRPCVTPLTDAEIEHARQMVVKGRPLTREQFEVVGAVAYEMIATRPRIARYLRLDPHGTRSALGRAFIDMVQRLAVLDVLRADAPLDAALAAYPPGRIAYDSFDHLVRSLSTWTLYGLQEARRATKQDRKDRAPEESRRLDSYVATAPPAKTHRRRPDAFATLIADAVPDEEAEIAGLTRLLPGVDEWLQAQREALSRDIAALTTLPPEKPWARPLMLKGSKEWNAWVQRRRQDIAWNKAQRGGRRRLLDSGKRPVTAADWERMAVDDRIGDFLADEQTVARLHDRLAVLKSIRRWNDRITHFASHSRQFWTAERPRHIRVRRMGEIAPSGPGSRHSVWPRGTTPFTPVPLAERTALRQGRGGDTTPGVVPLIEHCDAKDWGWKHGSWPAPRLINAEGPQGPCRAQRPYLKVGDVALPPDLPSVRRCCEGEFDGRKPRRHDRACPSARSYFYPKVR